MPKRRRGEKKTTYFDYNLLFIIIFLLCFGLVMLYSSSSYTSANKYGDSAHYLKLQARNIAIGLVFMFYFAKKDYHVWRKFGRLAYWGALGFCFVVLAKIPGLTRSSHGQSRWIQVEWNWLSAIGACKDCRHYLSGDADRAYSQAAG